MIKGFKITYYQPLICIFRKVVFKKEKSHGTNKKTKINYDLINKVFDLYLPAAYLPSNGASAAVHVLALAAAVAAGSAAAGSLAAAAAVSLTVKFIQTISIGVPQGVLFGLVLSKAFDTLDIYIYQSAFCGWRLDIHFYFYFDGVLCLFSSIRSFRWFEILFFSIEIAKDSNFNRRLISPHNSSRLFLI